MLIYIYHGFLAYASDTIETVPYALWMSDSSLFSADFHVQSLSKIFPNERWSISYILHFFPDHIYLASRSFHLIFSVFLISGMIQFSDMLLRNIEWSVLAVFITLIALYNINVGSNELYYNMFVPSLAAKGIAVWALVFFWKQEFIYASLALALSCFLHPLVGLQLFVVFSGILLLKQIFDSEKAESRVWPFFVIFLLTAGVWIFFILWAQGPKVEELLTFNDIVEFRIAHHFIPSYFPRSHIAFYLVLYSIAIYQFSRKSRMAFYFMLISLLGVIIYVVGLTLELELVLSSQWMKINIWLKFLSIIAMLQLIKGFTESKIHRMLVLGIFIIALVLSIFRFNPKYDAPYKESLYGWITINTNKTDLFLVPPELVDFKARTHRSSYFDFKAMLHHRPEIYEWARRFEQVYNMKIGDRTPAENIFLKIKAEYPSGLEILNIKDLDYLILRTDMGESVIKGQLEANKLFPVFLGNDYVVYPLKNK